MAGSTTVIVTFDDGSQHRYDNVPASVTKDQVIERAEKDYPNKKVKKANKLSKGSSKPDTKIVAMAKTIQDEMDALIDTDEDAIGEELNKISTMAEWDELRKIYTNLTGEDLFEVLKKQFDEEDKKTYLKPMLERVISEKVEGLPDPVDYNSSKELLQQVLKIKGIEFVLTQDEINGIKSQL